MSLPSHEAESFEHLELKASLYDWASKESHTEVESYLADFQQIADLLVVDKNLALEVQSAPIFRTLEGERCV